MKWGMMSISSKREVLERVIGCYYRQEHITFTRSRQYHKNDQAHVEHLS